jgi:hypothetical protein
MNQQEGKERNVTQHRYQDAAGRVLFTDTGIGRRWATYHRKANGSLKRLVSKTLPPRDTQAEAEADLAQWAESHGAKRLDPLPGPADRLKDFVAIANDCYRFLADNCHEAEEDAAELMGRLETLLEIEP